MEPSPRLIVFVLVCYGAALLAVWGMLPRPPVIGIGGFLNLGGGGGGSTLSWGPNSLGILFFGRPYSGPLVFVNLRILGFGVGEAVNPQPCCGRVRLGLLKRPAWSHPKP